MIIYAIPLHDYKTNWKVIGLGRPCSLHLQVGRGSQQGCRWLIVCFLRQKQMGESVVIKQKSLSTTLPWIWEEVCALVTKLLASFLIHVFLLGNIIHRNNLLSMSDWLISAFQITQKRGGWDGSAIRPCCQRKAFTNSPPHSTSPIKSSVRRMLRFVNNDQW